MLDFDELASGPDTSRLTHGDVFLSKSFHPLSFDDDVLRELVVVLPGHVGPKLVDEAVDLAQAEDSKRLKETEAR